MPSSLIAIGVVGLVVALIALVHGSLGRMRTGGRVMASGLLVVAFTAFTVAGVAAPTAVAVDTTASTTALPCTASMSDPHPHHGHTTSVLVRTAARASVVAAAHYRTTTTTHKGVAAANGRASISFKISNATYGFTVKVTVTVTAHGVHRSCATSFTPRP